MIPSFVQKFRRFSKRLWVRAALISGLAILAGLLAPLGNYLPFQIQATIDRETLQDLLDILNNSMLTVATFSLSIMVTAHLAADGTATPRAYRLLQQDGRTQTVIATFLGAFVYALTLTIMLNTGLFADDELALIYLVSVGVIALVVVAILRWIGHLDGLGSVEATLRRAEERARQSVTEHNAAPYLGGRALTGEMPDGAAPIRSEQTGYIHYVLASELSRLAGEHNAHVYLAKRAGAWVSRGEVLARVTGAPPDGDLAAAYRGCFAIEDRREHGQDMAYSLLILTEIGERALSPGINDPRTGIYAISRLSRLILDIDPEKEMAEPVAPNVSVPAVDMQALVATTLDPISRDGRTFFEICQTIQTAARDLSRHRDPDVAMAARTLSARGLSYARDGVLLIDDLRSIASGAIAAGPALTTVGTPDEAVTEAIGREEDASFWQTR